ncbi:MAG: A/G-specific adenine glycosylase [Actinobacteria bacterium]|nr:A/G-specific adenine glycosylase [Actinomycetota bacterium]
MLQQTQVVRVVPRWERFLERWPNPRACAAASLGDVLGEWHGLGYPRRARDLRLAASACVERHGGLVPDSLDELMALPGVGPYTARAVLAFAFEAHVGVVDTNVARVLARRAGRRLRPKEAQEIADAWVPSGLPWAWNQVVMDLGATRCRATPDCDGCPVDCAWRGAGRPHPDPAVGSAAVSRRQSRFQGSDREMRGRVLAAMTTDDTELAGIEQRLRSEGFDPGRVHAVVESLVADGLIGRDVDGRLRPP